MHLSVKITFGVRSYES